MRKGLARNIAAHSDDGLFVATVGWRSILVALAQALQFSINLILKI